MAAAHQHAQDASAIKVQVTVDVICGELLVACEFLTDGLHDQFHLVRVVRVVAARGGEELLHQHVVDLLGRFAFEGQM